MATKDELEAGKREFELERLKRQSKIENWNDHFEFIASKAVGVLSAGFGTLEILSPDIIPYVTPNPQYVIAFGVALLTGRNALKILKKITSSL